MLAVTAFCALSLQGTIYIYGISHIKIYVREIRATYESHVYFSAPNWNQEYKTRIVAGRNGEDGKNGIDGPRGKFNLPTVMYNSAHSSSLLNCFLSC